MTAARLTAGSALVAVLAPAVVIGVQFAGGPQRPAGLVVLTVLGTLAAVVALVLGIRRRDLPTAVLGAAVVVASVPMLLRTPPGVVLVSGGQVLWSAAQALVVVFGVLVALRSGGWVRALGWTVAVIGAVRVVYNVLLAWVPWWTTLPQDALGVVLAVPPVLEVLVFLAAAVLFVPVAAAPVGDGVRWLWRTAEVR